MCAVDSTATHLGNQHTTNTCCKHNATNTQPPRVMEGPQTPGLPDGSLQRHQVPILPLHTSPIAAAAQQNAPPRHQTVHQRVSHNMAWHNAAWLPHTLSVWRGWKQQEGYAGGSRSHTSCPTPQKQQHPQSASTPACKPCRQAPPAVPLYCCIAAVQYSTPTDQPVITMPMRCQPSASWQSCPVARSRLARAAAAGKLPWSVLTSTW